MPPADREQFRGAWRVKNRKRLQPRPGNLLMRLNWPQQVGLRKALQRLVEFKAANQEFFQEVAGAKLLAYHDIQGNPLGRRYGLAGQCFPAMSGSGGGAWLPASPTTAPAAARIRQL